MVGNIDRGGSLCYLLPVASKIERKQLKQPDQFVSFWTKAGTTLAARKKGIGIGAVALAAVIGVIWVAGSYVEGRQASESRAFARVEKIAMAGLITEGKDAPKFDDDLPHFKTETERQDAAAKELDAFLATHASSPLKNHGLLLRARFQLLAGKAADAVATYQQVLAGAMDKRLRFVAQEGLGMAHEAAGDKDKALGIFSALADEAQGAGSFYGDRALFDKARILVAKGNSKDAEKILHEILDKSPTSTLRDEINDRLAVLEGK